MRFVHPYSHKMCTIKRTQVPVMPAFAMTAHKAQGQSMDRAIIDLESCSGTESPHVMISRVRSLSGLRLLRPFNIAKIQCRQSEDSRSSVWKSSPKTGKRPGLDRTRTDRTGNSQD